MKSSRLAVAVACMPWFCANYVPPSTEQQLAAKSDLVVIGTVTKVGLGAPAAPPDRSETGEFVVYSLAGSPCATLRVEQTVKGEAPSAMQVCTHRIRELNPRPLQRGKRYKMFLTSAGSVYVATSWDAFKPVP